MGLAGSPPTLVHGDKPWWAGSQLSSLTRTGPTCRPWQQDKRTADGQQCKGYPKMEGGAHTGPTTNRRVGLLLCSPQRQSPPSMAHLRGSRHPCAVLLQRTSWLGLHDARYCASCLGRAHRNMSRAATTCYYAKAGAACCCCCCRCCTQ